MARPVRTTVSTPGATRLAAARAPRRAVSCRAAAVERPAPQAHSVVPTEDHTLPNGDTLKVMAVDFGFRTGATRLYEEHYGEVPKGLFNLAFENFGNEWKQMRRMFVKGGFKPVFDAQEAQSSSVWTKIRVWFGRNIVRGFKAADNALVSTNVLMSMDDLAFDDDDEEMTASEVKDKLSKLQLDAHRVTQIEKDRFKANPPDAPWFIRAPYHALCIVLDLIYEGRPIQRFWVLEEVARMPYFAYISMLHLYESLGWWRAGAALRKVHFAEEWNELHHLQIMESLGGDNAWLDRFMAQHAALAYYWGVCILYALSPKYAYQFSELVEGHATDTYEVFASENKELLKSLPPPRVAVEYYLGADPYMFKSFGTSQESQCRNPKCNTLHDVFCNIIDDEVEHKKTMVACQEPETVAKQMGSLNDVACDVPESGPE